MKAKVKEETEDAEMEAKNKQLRLRAKVKTETTDAALKQRWMAKAKERVLASAANARSKTAPMRPQTFRIPPRASPVRTPPVAVASVSGDWRADADARIQAGILERRDQRLAQEGASPVRTAARASPVRTNRAAPPFPK